jgi:CRISPR-associated endonuclease/helicase Cas3
VGFLHRRGPPGLAVAADWLGSNTRWFGYCKPTHDLEDYWNNLALPQARQAIDESGLVPASSAAFHDIRTLFPQIRTATPLQSWAEKAPIDDGPQIFVIEELTGGGKTEAALTLAARLMAAGQGQGLYLALPTMATADTMFDRLCRKDDKDGLANWQRFFVGDSAQLMLAHSADRLKLRLEEKNRRDAGYPKGEEIFASRHCTAWLADSRKKALLADFGIGTIDQAFLSVLPVRHQSLRLLGLAGKVLIVDEVHACDCYMGELLACLLRFHAALGGSVILLSATLPENHRARYLEAFAEGAGLPPPKPVSCSYPLTSQWSANRWEELPHTARKESARPVAVQALGDEAEVFARLKQRLARGGGAVWTRNSVADAIETWRRWQQENPEYPATLFHARFALKDRLDIGGKVLQSFGPDSTPETRSGKLVIATQVIEQSLDADFDDMVTDLAPIDSIIQRTGRLQRHCRDAQGTRRHEPNAVDGRGGAQIGVLMPEPAADAEAGWIGKLLPKTGKVYPDHGKLWLTADWLKENQGFKLPAQARKMIEWVYSEELETYERIPEALQEISDKADGVCRAGKSTARGIFKGLVEKTVQAAHWVCGIIRGRIKDALLGDSDTRGDLSYVQLHFWNSTDAAFYSHVRKLRDVLGELEKENQILESWRTSLRNSALIIFDHYAQVGDFDYVDPRTTAVARNDLNKTMNGKKLRDLLGLPQPDRNTSKSQRKTQ